MVTTLLQVIPQRIDVVCPQNLGQHVQIWTLSRVVMNRKAYHTNELILLLQNTILNSVCTMTECVVGIKNEKANSA